MNGRGAVISKSRRPTANRAAQQSKHGWKEKTLQREIKQQAGGSIAISMMWPGEEGERDLFPLLTFAKRGKATSLHRKGELEGTTKPPSLSNHSVSSRSLGARN